MKRLLIPLLAVLSLPTAVNAETYWLIMHSRSVGRGEYGPKVEMESIDQCREQGEIFQSANFKNINKFICLKGK